jgi:glutamate dehydrogenase/leucine dehydrogenase
LLEKEGASIAAISTVQGAIYNRNGLDIGALLELRKVYGDACVLHYHKAKALSLDELLLLDVNILLPCARPWSINVHNAAELQVDLIVPGANIPVTPSAERILFDRSILYIPDFVASAGGVYGSAMVARGFQEDEIRHLIQHEFADKVTRMLEEARRVERMPGEVAKALAWDSHLRLAKTAATQTKGLSALTKKIVQKGLRGSLVRGAYIFLRRGWGKAQWIRNIALEDSKSKLAMGQFNQTPGS